MKHELPPNLADTFTDPLRSALVTGLEHTYEHLMTPAELPGADNTLEGVALYRTPQHWLPQDAADFGLEALMDSNALMYRVGPVLFSCQRVARTFEPIAGAFPNSYRIGLRHLRDYQSGQKLFSFMEVDYAHAPALVLAHMGNERDGLLGVYLCCPALVKNGKVKCWDFAIPLYEAQGGGDAERGTTPHAVDLPAIEPVGEPIVRPRRKRERGHGV